MYQDAGFKEGDMVIIYAVNARGFHPFIAKLGKLPSGQLHPVLESMDEYKRFANLNAPNITSKDFLSFAISFTPADFAKDAADFIAGKDIITGDEVNRMLLAACIVTPELMDQAMKMTGKNADNIAAFLKKGKITRHFVSDKALIHSTIGEFTYNSRTGVIQNMKSGGHSQANIDFLKANNMEYNIVKTYPNGVRVGNVKQHKKPQKREGTGQSWFPTSWTNTDIRKAGLHVSNLPKNYNAPDGVIVFGNYKNVRVGVMKTNGKIATVFPDSMKQP